MRGRYFSRLYFGRGCIGDDDDDDDDAAATNNSNTNKFEKHRTRTLHCLNIRITNQSNFGFGNPESCIHLFHLFTHFLNIYIDQYINKYMF